MTRIFFEELKTAVREFPDIAGETMIAFPKL